MSGFESLTEKVVNVRKPHKCIWCGEMIETKAVYRSYIWQGDFNSDYLHPECEKAMRADDDDVYDEGFMPHMNDRPHPNKETP